MGWLRTLLLGDIGNRLDIADTEYDIARLRQNVRRKNRAKNRTDEAQDQRLADLEGENEQLKVYLASLVRLLVSKGTLSPEELASFVDVIDPEEEGGAEGS